MPARHTHEQHVNMHRAAWDEGHRYLAAKRKRLPGWGDVFRDGTGTFNPLERKLLDPIGVDGADVLQTSCAGDASQAFSFALLGARVTASDFSAVAIEEARQNAAAFGLKVHFQVEDTQRLDGLDNDRFDLVHVDGNLWCYEDLPLACRNWHRVLRPGGRLFLHEGHPLSGRCLEEQEDGAFRIVRGYTDKTPEYYRFGIQDFVSESLDGVDFQHTLADMLNAVMQAGFVWEQMLECDAENASFRAGGLGKKAAAAGLPHDFYLIARKKE